MYAIRIKKLNVYLQKMERVKKIFKIVSDIGVDEKSNITDKFRVRFINGLHFLIAIILMIGIAHWIILDKKPFTYIELFCLSLSIIGLVLNHFKYFKCSAILFYLYCNFLIVYNIEFYPKEIAGYVYYFPFAMVLGINNMSIIKDKVSYVLLLVSFVIFLFVVFVDFSDIFPASWIVQFSEDEINWVRNFNIAIAGLCVLFFTYFYMWLSNAQTLEIRQLIEKEKKLQQELLQTLNQKEILLAEVHHRVNNNLSILKSIINMNLDSYSGKNKNDVLLSLQNRIHNMSIVHNLLYKHENMDLIPIHKFTRNILSATLKHNDVSDIKITEHYDELGNIKISAVIPFGIILNELITNAIQHAFKSHHNPSICINMYRQDGKIILNIQDNGKGFEEYQKDGLGIELIKILVEQINGEISFQNSNGLCVKISVPAEELSMVG